MVSIPATFRWARSIIYVAAAFVTVASRWHHSVEIGEYQTWTFQAGSKSVNYYSNWGHRIYEHRILPNFCFSLYLQEKFYYTVEFA